MPALALFYDATPTSKADLTAWVHLHSQSRSVVAYSEDGTVFISEAWSEDGVTLAPGHFLVLARDASLTRWAAHSPAQLATWFEVRPRELPIFADGEIAS